MNHAQPVTEARDTTPRLTVIAKLLAKAEAAGVTDAERDAYVEKAAELMARYGVDEAMLAEAGKTADPVVDTVIWVVRPFSNRMMDLLWYIAQPMGAEARTVKQHTGSDREGALKWRYGLRLFVHKSDLARIEMMFTSARNQALAGASKIRGYDQFGQDQKAHRDSYVEGFSHAIAARVRRAEEQAKQAAEAEREALTEQALLEGTYTPSRSVELVLADRRAVVKNAMNLAVYRKSTAELAAQRAAQDERWAESDRKAAERRAARVAEQQSCKRCQAAKSGYCNDHRDMRPSQAQGRSYERVGSYYHDGYDDGQRADLSQTATQVTNATRPAID
jgi:hypothetical protein